MTNRRSDNPISPAARRGVPRRAFTLVELMVVILVVAVLAGVLLTALGRAFRYAKASSTARLLDTVGKAIEAFRTDLGYEPPLLYDPDEPDPMPGATMPSGGGYVPNFRVPDAMVGPGSGFAFPSLDRLIADTADRDAQMFRPFRFYSHYSITVYLAGVGDLDGSERGGASPAPAGVADDRDDGLSGPGIRSPGPDRSWGGAKDRRNAVSLPISGAGRVYGPYLDVAGLSGAMKRDVNSGLFTLEDSWGRPIRYYKGWPTRDRSDPPQVSVRRLPVELRTVEALAKQIEDGSGNADLSLETEALRAPFMLLSAGGDPPGMAIAPSVEFGRFGDYKDEPASSRGIKPTHTLDRDFNPSTLNEEQRGQLLRDLKSNVRYSP